MTHYIILDEKGNREVEAVSPADAVEISYGIKDRDFRTMKANIYGEDFSLVETVMSNGDLKTFYVREMSLAERFTSYWREILVSYEWFDGEWEIAEAQLRHEINKNFPTAVESNGTFTLEDGSTLTPSGANTGAS